MVRLATLQPIGRLGRRADWSHFGAKSNYYLFVIIQDGGWKGGQP